MARIGVGYDVHKLVEGRKLVLGGVEIKHDLGLEGHSDADVALHALVDALLGAAALGDIGTHFPPSDPKWKNVDSRRFLEAAAELVSAHGFKVGNVDLTIVAEQPKIAPHVALMRERIAFALDVEKGAVSIKATTNESIGFIGRGEGIAAIAVAIIEPT